MYLVMILGAHFTLVMTKSDIQCKNSTQHIVLIIRGLTGTSFGIFLFYGLANYKLADFITVVQTNPIFCSLISYFFLSSKISKNDIIAIFISSCGIFCVLKPDFIFEIF